VPATTPREHRRMKGAGDLWFQAFVRIARNRHHPTACDASGGHNLPWIRAKGRISP
jgi:hypothetical protein